MAGFAVNERSNRLLRERMEALGVSEKDIEEKFIKSSGKGGQKVNKTATCVYLKHLPTGLEVKCMKDRSQSVNRFLARRELLGKIEEYRGFCTEENRKENRTRKQKAKRARRSREKYAPEKKVAATGSAALNETV